MYVSGASIKVSDWYALCHFQLFDYVMNFFVTHILRDCVHTASSTFVKSNLLCL